MGNAERGNEPVLIDALNPGVLTGRGNNTWLLDGAEPTLIDAGVGVTAHVEAVAAALNGRALTRVLVTHGHPDHASGVPALRARWPALEACKWIDAKASLDREPGWTSLADQQGIRGGDATLTVVHTPGHALDHVCFWNETTRSLYNAGVPRYNEMLDEYRASRARREGVAAEHNTLIAARNHLVDKYNLAP